MTRTRRAQPKGAGKVCAKEREGQVELGAPRRSPGGVVVEPGSGRWRGLGNREWRRIPVSTTEKKVQEKRLRLIEPGSGRWRGLGNREWGRIPVSTTEKKVQKKRLRMKVRNDESARLSGLEAKTNQVWI